MKECKTCGEVKPLTAYTPSRVNAGGYLPNCKACRNAKNRSYATTESRRAAHIKHKYGLLPEDIERMRHEQGDCCAICRTALAGWGHKTGPHVDHDHETGKVRGLLCAACNLGLGKFRDSAAVLERAAAYLRRVS